MKDFTALYTLQGIMNVVAGQHPHAHEHLQIPEKDKWMGKLKYTCMLLRAKREDRINELVSWAKKLCADDRGWARKFKISALAGYVDPNKMRENLQRAASIF